MLFMNMEVLGVGEAKAVGSHFGGQNAEIGAGVRVEGVVYREVGIYADGAAILGGDYGGGDNGVAS